MANTNMGPVLDLVRQRVPVTDISVGPTSGWRERDDARVQEIVDLCYGGQMGMTIFGGVVLLKDQTDVALRYIIDDGLSTVLAWQQMSTEYLNDNDTNPMGEPWDPRVVEVMTTGLVITFATYPDGNDDLGHREAWNAGKHDEENNKYRPTSLHKKLDIVRKRYQRSNQDWAAVTQQLIAIFGKGRYSTIQRWVSSCIRRGSHSRAFFGPRAPWCWS